MASVWDGFTNSTTNYSYDADGRLLCAEILKGEDIIQSIQYQYDDLNRLTGKIVISPSTTPCQFPNFTT
ncbi:MAG: hypothetical protein E7453_04805 [Ruminococcaceae bacterium]|nr:hypothetical protein [Oscillospiraceae bacterium]